MKTAEDFTNAEWQRLQARLLKFVKSHERNLAYVSDCTKRLKINRPVLEDLVEDMKGHGIEVDLVGSNGENKMTWVEFYGEDSNA